MRKQKPIMPTWSDRPFAVDAKATFVIQTNHSDKEAFIPSGEFRCHIVVGSDGYSARFFVPQEQVYVDGREYLIELQFLIPTRAAAVLPVGTQFKVLGAKGAIGQGVIQHLN